jgi:hypothetical protein
LWNKEFQSDASKGWLMQEVSVMSCNDG